MELHVTKARPSSGFDLRGAQMDDARKQLIKDKRAQMEIPNGLEEASIGLSRPAAVSVAAAGFRVRLAPAAS